VEIAGGRAGSGVLGQSLASCWLAGGRVVRRPLGFDRQMLGQSSVLARSVAPFGGSEDGGPRRAWRCDARTFDGEVGLSNP